MSENNLVVKANDLVEARHVLSINEQKMILYAISKIDRDSDKMNKITIKVKEFIELLDLNNTDRYGSIKQISKSLTTQSLEIKKDNGGWIVTTWLSSAEYIPNSAEIELEFSSKLTPYLLQLKKRFTRYELQNIIYMKSKHSIRLYELLKQYQKIGVRRFQIDEFRDFMNLGDSYPRNYDLEQYVIKIAVEEINDLTDIKIEYEKNKKGRNIVGFIFTINSKDMDNKLWVEYLEDYYNIEEIKQKLGLSDKNLSALQVMNLYEISVSKTSSDEIDPFMYCNLNYQYILQKKENIRNIYSYLVKAIEEDYANAAFLLKMQKDMNNF